MSKKNNWKCKSLTELTTMELYEILKAREEVFIVEQNVVYHDIDFKDKVSQHLFLENEEGEVIAYARLLPRGVNYAEASIGRVLTKKSHRSTGLGKELMEEGMAFIQNVWQEKEIRISGQLYLLKFYTSLGYEQVSGIYLEDGIDHVELLFTAKG